MHTIFPSDRLRKLRYGCTVGSFWAACAIWLKHAGFGSLFVNATLRDSGNRDQQDMEKLAENMLPGFELPFCQLVDLADGYGLFENLIPREENDPHAVSKRKKLSDLFRKYSGRIFKGGQKLLIVGENSKPAAILSTKFAKQVPCWPVPPAGSGLHET